MSVTGIVAQVASVGDCVIRRVRPSTPAAWEVCTFRCPSPQAAFPRTLQTPPSPPQVLGTRGPPCRSVQAQPPSLRDCSLAASLQHAGCPGQPGSRALALQGQRGSVLPALAVHPAFSLHLLQHDKQCLRLHLPGSTSQVPSWGMPPWNVPEKSECWLS